MQSQIVHGFSKLSRDEQIEWLQRQNGISGQALTHLESHLHSDPSLRDLYGDISENTISSYYLPFSLAPNFLINDSLMTLPMVIEESSVVAAASHAAKFWALNGGFHAEIAGTRKNGQVHFTWDGGEELLQQLFLSMKDQLFRSVHSLTSRMEERGGGLESMEIRATGPHLPDHYQLFVTFQTADAMGANFINTVLEELGSGLKSMETVSGNRGRLEVVMAILSNYTPECLVRCHVETHTRAFDHFHHRLSGQEFAVRFKQAVDIACHDPYRAVTHNKGIFNGMDAVIMATGNDFRAVEACGHAFAARKARYGSLSCAELSGDLFRLTLEVPLALGTVGGLTSTHPMAGVALEILGHPGATDLMKVVAAAGLANNFSAVRSLVTTGIQKGHMKMHLGNILRQLNATPKEIRSATQMFSNRTVSYSEVSAYIEKLRGKGSS